jgi:predicted nucleic acid-binding Zn ribbon protein
MARTKSPTKISALVGDLYQILGLEDAYQQFKTLQVWNTVVGEAIAEATVLERFSGGQLFIRVKNPSWRMELNFRKTEILVKLNTALDNVLVREIIFR